MQAIAIRKGELQENFYKINKLDYHQFTIYVYTYYYATDSNKMMYSMSKSISASNTRWENKIVDQFKAAIIMSWTSDHQFDQGGEPSVMDYLGKCLRIPRT